MMKTEFEIKERLGLCEAKLLSYFTPTGELKELDETLPTFYSGEINALRWVLENRWIKNE